MRKPSAVGAAHGERRGLHTLLHFAPVYAASQWLLVQLSGEVIEGATARALGQVEGRRVLEIGCGTGGMVHRLPGARYLGTDVNEQYLDSCRRRLPGDYAAMPATRIDLPDASVDAAFSIGVFHHLGDEEVRSHFAEMARVLCPGGTLVVTDGVWPLRRWNLLGWVLRKADRGRHMRTRERLEELAAQAERLRIAESRPISGRLLDYCVVTLVKPGERTAPAGG